MILMTCQNIFINIYLISRDPFKKLIAKLKHWYKNPHRLRRKFTLKYIKKVSGRYLKEKKLEIKDALLIEIQNSEMEAIPELSEIEESEDLDVEIQKAWNKQYLEQNPKKFQKPPLPKPETELVTNIRKKIEPKPVKQLDKTVTVKVNAVDDKRKQERKQMMNEIKQRFERKEKLTNLESSHEMTRNRLKSKA
jgi:hypothetical protein